MKLLFLKDALPTARAGEVKEVKKGFGRNYLLPKGIAVLATKQALIKAEDLRREAEERRKLEMQSWAETAKKLEDSGVILEARGAPSGKLYGSITQVMIAEAVSEVCGRNVLRKNVSIQQPIRTAGTHTVPVKLVEDIWAKTAITIKLEGAPEQKVEKPTADKTEKKEEPTPQNDKASTK